MRTFWQEAKKSLSAFFYIILFRYFLIINIIYMIGGGLPDVMLRAYIDKVF